VVVQQRGGHLASAGVVDTDEQHLGHVLHDGSFGLAKGAQPVAGEPVYEQRDEFDHTST
jgi:hypothetical protein